jgi:hypothetical protein
MAFVRDFARAEGNPGSGVLFSQFSSFVYERKIFPTDPRVLFIPTQPQLEKGLRKVVSSVTSSIL